jgi:hypothetical protein
MHLIEIFLPLADNSGRPFPKELLLLCQKEMADKFGGVTLFARAPAEGIDSHNGNKTRDNIVVMEIMVTTVNRRWWSTYRHKLEQRFTQDEILIRATAIDKL